MEPATPLSQLVLWVPPAMAAGWEQLAPERQAALTQELMHWLTSKLLPQPPRDSMGGITSLSVAELKAFVEDLERKFQRMAEDPLP